MQLPPEEFEAAQEPPRRELLRWLGPIVLGASIGMAWRLVFHGHPHSPYNAMMASFAVLVPMIIGAVTVIVAERSLPQKLELLLLGRCCRQCALHFRFALSWRFW
jgi:hypothetical protein